MRQILKDYYDSVLDMLLVISIHTGNQSLVTTSKIFCYLYRGGCVGQQTVELGWGTIGI